MKSRMFPWAFCVAAMTLAASFERASATPITINFTGVVTESNGGIDPIGPFPALPGPYVGDAFFGSITYDLEPPAILYYGEGVVSYVSNINDPLVFESPSGISFYYPNDAGHVGSISLLLSTAGEVVGGSFDFNGSPYDVFTTFSGVINSAPDASSSLALMLVGLVGLAWFRSRALPKSS